jgi:hypothetical protein
MQVKLLEIRDKGTFVPVLCVDMNPATGGPLSVLKFEAQRYLLRRCGYPCDGRPNIAMTPLRANGDKCWNDPYGWGGRTYPVAHNYIYEHWDELLDGDVIDVEFILGETAHPKASERVSESL